MPWQAGQSRPIIWLHGFAGEPQPMRRYRGQLVPVRKTNGKAPPIAVAAERKPICPASESRTEPPDLGVGALVAWGREGRRGVIKALLEGGVVEVEEAAAEVSLDDLPTHSPHHGPLMTPASGRRWRLAADAVRICAAAI